MPRLSIVRTVFRKELTEMLRDRRSLAVMFGLPLVLYPVLAIGLATLGESRKKELQVFDLSFADEVHSATAIPQTSVDRFFQFQIRDSELQHDVLSKLPGDILAKMDLQRHLKTWSMVRTIFRQDPATCDLGLSPWGRQRLPACERTVRRIRPPLIPRLGGPPARQRISSSWPLPRLK